jgi:hypothetical protein
LRAVEAVSTQDLLAALLGALAVAGSGAALILGGRRHEIPSPAPARVPVAAAGLLVLALAVPGMAAPHAHGADHGHDVAAGGEDHAHATPAGATPADEAGAEHDMDHGHDGGDAPDGAEHVDHAGAGPRITSFDDPRLSAEQRRKARELYDRTVRWTARYTDVASVVAAGYDSIGDSLSGFEHFVNHTFEDDGIELDPERVEAFVFDTKPGQPKKLAAAMFILEPGKDMDDTPEIAGSLTTWHRHDDLCWDPSGTRVTGLSRQGRCIPGGTLRVTPPMLHIWPEAQACGPFAEADTSGSGLDRILRQVAPTTTEPVGADPCQHVHGGH